MTPLDLQIEELRPGVMWAALAGELDSANAYVVDSQLRRAEEHGPSVLLIDLRGLSFMDSTGLARLLAAHRRAKRGGWRLVLVRGCSAVQRVLTMSGLRERFEIVASPRVPLPAMAPDGAMIRASAAAIAAVVAPAPAAQPAPAPLSAA
jgi:stage II sporulation protein AA (anti-sigma F factor antagonist)